MQRPWRSATDWLALYGFLSLLYYKTQKQKPSMTIAGAPWTIPTPTSINNYENALWAHLQPDVKGVIFSVEVPSSQMSSLCQSGPARSPMQLASQVGLPLESLSLRCGDRPPHPPLFMWVAGTRTPVFFPLQQLCLCFVTFYGYRCGF